MDNQTTSTFSQSDYNSPNFDNSVTKQNKKGSFSLVTLFTILFFPWIVGLFAIFEVFSKRREAEYKGIFRKRDAIFIVYFGTLSLYFIIIATYGLLMLLGTGGNEEQIRDLLDNTETMLVDRFGMGIIWGVGFSMLAFGLLIFSVVMRSYKKIYARCPDKKHGTLLFNMYIVIAALSIKIMFIPLIFTGGAIIIGESTGFTLGNFGTVRDANGTFHRIGFNSAGHGFIEGRNGFQPAFVDYSGRVVPPS